MLVTLVLVVVHSGGEDHHHCHCCVVVGVGSSGAVVVPLVVIAATSANKHKAIQSSTWLHSTTDVIERYLLMQRFTEIHSTVYHH